MSCFHLSNVSGYSAPSQEYDFSAEYRHSNYIWDTELLLVTTGPLFCEKIIKNMFLEYLFYHGDRDL